MFARTILSDLVFSSSCPTLAAKALAHSVVIVFEVSSCLLPSPKNLLRPKQQTSVAAKIRHPLFQTESRTRDRFQDQSHAQKTRKRPSKRLHPVEKKKTAKTR